MLEVLRSQIDECDAILTDTLLRRFMTAARIAEYKKENNLTLYQPKREDEILNKIRGSLPNSPYAIHVEDFYRSIFRLSRCIQMNHLFPFNMVLIGFMGSGKTAIGKYLADMIGYTLYDIDTIVEQEAGKTIIDIFSQDGEACFRSLERQVIDRISKSDHAVISCGGGSILDQSNVLHLKQKGKLIWLMAEPETLYKRIRYQVNRPLTINKNLDEIIEMIKSRQPLYSKAADYRLSVDSQSVNEIADNIIKMVCSD